jgi:predicted regulator of Ras-like GTPase activity (Roadblock/LC7/MglB family)
MMERCPGCRAAAIVDPDGIPVVVEPDAAEVETLGAELAALIRDIGEAGRELDHGQVLQFTVAAERARIVLTTMAAGYFLVMVLGPDGIVGRAQFVSRLTGERLHSEFI